MDFNGVMTELEQMGTAQNVKIYRRHGATGPLFGVSYANLDALAKKLKKATTAEQRQALAFQLWDSGNQDARVLATKIVDGRQMTQAELERWAAGLDNYGLTDAFCDVAAQSPLRQALAEGWLDAEDEWLGRAGWHLLARQVLADTDRSDAEYEAYLGRIEAGIHTRKNRVREAMNNTLIAIGARSPSLMEAALAAAQRIGKVDVDHGETGCKTPDAGEYILKTVAHRQAAAERARARQKT